MTPHQLRIRRRRAALVEGQKFFVLGRRRLEFTFQVKFLRHLNLETLDLAHFGEGLHGNLLEIGQLRTQPGGA